MTPRQETAAPKKKTGAELPPQEPVGGVVVETAIPSPITKESFFGPGAKPAPRSVTPTRAARTKAVETEEKSKVLRAEILGIVGVGRWSSLDNTDLARFWASYMRDAGDSTTATGRRAMTGVGVFPDRLLAASQELFENEKAREASLGAAQATVTPEESRAGLAEVEAVQAGAVGRAQELRVQEAELAKGVFGGSEAERRKLREERERLETEIPTRDQFIGTYKSLMTNQQAAATTVTVAKEMETQLGMKFGAYVERPDLFFVQLLAGPAAPLGGMAILQDLVRWRRQKVALERGYQESERQRGKVAAEESERLLEPRVDYKRIDMDLARIGHAFDNMREIFHDPGMKYTDSVWFFALMMLAAGIEGAATAYLHTGRGGATRSYVAEYWRQLRAQEQERRKADMARLIEEDRQRKAAIGMELGIRREERAESRELRLAEDTMRRASAEERRARTQEEKDVIQILRQSADDQRREIDTDLRIIESMSLKEPARQAAAARMAEALRKVEEINVKLDAILNPAQAEVPR